MSDFVSAMGSLFTFLFAQLTNMADFFVESTIGQIIIGLLIFALLGSLVSAFLHRR